MVMGWWLGGEDDRLLRMVEEDTALDCDKAELVLAVAVIGCAPDPTPPPSVPA